MDQATQRNAALVEQAAAAATSMQDRDEDRQRDRHFDRLRQRQRMSERERGDDRDGADPEVERAHGRAGRRTMDDVRDDVGRPALQLPAHARHLLWPG
jgi:hypothetical protein